MAMKVKMPKKPPIREEGYRNQPIGKFLIPILIISIVSTAITVGVWHFTMKNIETPEPKCMTQGDPGAVYLQFSKESSAGNWTLESLCNQPYIPLSSVLLTINHPNGTTAGLMDKIPLSSLTQGKWEEYHVLFVNIGGENYVRLGARVIIDATMYPSPYRYIFTGPANVLCTGSF